MFRRGSRLDPSQVKDRRGAGGIAAAGGGIGILVLIASALLGVDLSALTDVAQTGQTSQSDGMLANCQTGADANQSEDCRIVGFVNSIQAYWEDEFAGNGGRYQQADTVLFSGSVQTACGNATSQVGPFYCPADQQVYIDLDFFDELESRFGAQGGPFAQAYVLAHEYGHHVQNLTGVLENARSGGSGPESGAVRVELQADCYGGLWAGQAVQTGFIEAVTDAQVGEALSAAAAVGDDRIQEATRGSVNLETWTHGSSEQRQAWFLRGYHGGSPEACDTFSGDF